MIGLGLYQTICYKVEDVFISMLSKKHKREQIKGKVDLYRAEKLKLREMKVTKKVKHKAVRS